MLRILYKQQQDSAENLNPNSIFGVGNRQMHLGLFGKEYDMLKEIYHHHHRHHTICFFNAVVK
jgi:hypothetical protein